MDYCVYVTAELKLNDGDFEWIEERCLILDRFDYINQDKLLGSAIAKACPSVVQQENWSIDYSYDEKSKEITFFGANSGPNPDALIEVLQYFRKERKRTDRVGVKFASTENEEGWGGGAVVTAEAVYAMDTELWIKYVIETLDQGLQPLAV